jgi:hypothetical protein
LTLLDSVLPALAHSQNCAAARIPAQKEQGDSGANPLWRDSRHRDEDRLHVERDEIKVVSGRPTCRVHLGKCVTALAHSEGEVAEKPEIVRGGIASIFYRRD